VLRRNTRSENRGGTGNAFALVLLNWKLLNLAGLKETPMVFDTPLHIVMDTIGYGAIILAFALFLLAMWHAYKSVLGARGEYVGWTILLGWFSPSNWFTDYGNDQRKKQWRYLLLSLLCFGIAAGWAALRSSGF
jgi:hypothetical protein